LVDHDRSGGLTIDLVAANNRGGDEIDETMVRSSRQYHNLEKSTVVTSVQQIGLSFEHTGQL
jgi:hypothetical protein